MSQERSLGTEILYLRVSYRQLSSDRQEALRVDDSGNTVLSENCHTTRPSRYIWGPPRCTCKPHVDCSCVQHPYAIYLPSFADDSCRGTALTMGDTFKTCIRALEYPSD